MLKVYYIRPSDHSTFLHPPNQSSPLTSSPSDIADPSPIATSSNGTDTTDIDDTGLATEESDSQPKPTPRLGDLDLKVSSLRVLQARGYDSLY